MKDAHDILLDLIMAAAEQQRAVSDVGGEERGSSMKDAHDILRDLITSATSSGSQMAEYRWIGSGKVVFVEIVNGVPTYFVGDEEVTATQAVEALEAA